MTTVTKQFIDSIQITTPPELNELLDTLLKNGKPKHNVDFMPDEHVPCLIYKEWIAGIGPPLYKPERRVIITRTNHDGIQGSLTHSISRDVLNLVRGSMGDQNRGKILVAFCEIEFVVDILICYSLGETLSCNGSLCIHSSVIDACYLTLKTKITCHDYACQ